MIKKVTKVIVESWELDKKEANAVLVCLDYAWHRLAKHNRSGLHGQVKKDVVDKLRKEMRAAGATH